jgi:hypothetical protein
MRGADGGPMRMLCALPAFWVSGFPFYFCMFFYELLRFGYIVSFLVVPGRVIVRRDFFAKYFGFDRRLDYRRKTNAKE